MKMTVTMEEAALSPVPPRAPRRYLRLGQVLDRIPVSKASFYAGIKTGRFPAPTHIGRLSVWPEEKIDDLALAIEEGKL